jgi:hypothetical protein
MTCAGFLVFPVSVWLMMGLKDLASGQEAYPNRQCRIAQEMGAHGLSKGSRIACIGYCMTADWARLLGVRIVVEIPARFYRRAGIQPDGIIDTVDTDSFWRATAQHQRDVLGAFQRAGAEAVVANLVPDWAPVDGWTRLQTPYHLAKGSEWTYIRFLRPAD